MPATTDVMVAGQLPTGTSASTSAWQKAGRSAGLRLVMSDPSTCTCCPPGGAGVAQIGLQAGPRRHRPPVHHVGLDQGPWAVADGRHRFARPHEAADEVDRPVLGAETVRVGHPTRAGPGRRSRRDGRRPPSGRRRRHRPGRGGPGPGPYPRRGPATTAPRPPPARRARLGLRDLLVTALATRNATFEPSMRRSAIACPPHVRRNTTYPGPPDVSPSHPGGWV